ncbi:hypothetical protein DRN87_01875 [Candidatus Geothermarchaeota archaeon]|nr:MAG: hypothetical protein DRN87_01875 [Candidatus Geothermarchaeota archaeon]HEW93096.1 hypothetical protein [Thermoprotei archaeon]
MYNVDRYGDIIEARDRIFKEVKREIPKLIKKITLSRRYEIRRIYRILRGLRDLDVRLYNRLLMESYEDILKLQLGRDYSYKVFIGRYAPDLDYKYIEVGEKYISDVEGGFPSLVDRDRVYIQGIYPDIDSTSMALNILIEAAKELNIYNDEIDLAIKNGLKYLSNRDINRDGLLEQYYNEDWAIGLYREGSVLYSNAVYIKTLENAFDLYIDVDREFSLEIQRRLSRCYEKIERLMWLKDHYIDSISSRGGIVDRYSLDTTEMGETLIYSRHDKLKTHLNTLIKAVEGIDGRWGLPAFSPSYAHIYRVFKDYIGYNGGVVPYYIVHLAKILLKYGFKDYSRGLLEYGIMHREILWRYGNISKRDPDLGLDTKIEILSISTKLIKKDVDI